METWVDVDEVKWYDIKVRTERVGKVQQQNVQKKVRMKGGVKAEQNIIISVRCRAPACPRARLCRHRHRWCAPGRP